MRKGSERHFNGEVEIGPGTRDLKNPESGFGTGLANVYVCNYF